MRNLIPHFIHEQFAQQTYGGSFEAAAMFVDISGFTQLTETLMQHQKDGAEVLTEVLNQIFNPLVAEVYAHGGFITTFAGDAFTAVFPRATVDDAPIHALHAAFFVQDFFAHHGLTQTRYGDFEMGVKVGLSVGQVTWGILGTAGRHTYFFRGAAIDACAGAEHHASKGNIIADEQIWPLIQAQVKAIPVEAHFKFTALSAATVLPRVSAPSALTRAALAPFVLDTAIDLTASDAKAEFREVAPVFISFDQPPDQNALNEFVAAVLELAGEYGGYFNKLDFGDKGGLMLILFGAPVTHERDRTRAVDFLLALQDVGAGFKPAPTWRAGLTFGTVYAGLMGGAERSEYTAIGDIVNLAARLMQGAGWGEIWLSDAVATRLQQTYQIDSLGEHKFKGKSGTLPVYRLTGRKMQSEVVFFTGEMVGRDAELTRLIQFVEPIFTGQFAGIAYVYGEAGMGKSRLTYELRQRLTQQHHLRWLLCPADEILRQSLNPFKYLLRQYFDQSPNRSMEEDKTRFNRILDALIADLRTSELARELTRTRSFLGALVDLHWENSLYEQLDPKLRFENILAAFKTLMQAESVRQPVVLRLENLQWIDADSQELVKVLTRNMAEYLIAVVCTSRYRDDGSRVILDVAEDVPQQVVELRTLTWEGIKAFAKQVLDGAVTGDLVRFLAEKTDGNPFFVEQLALDLQERGLLYAGDEGWDVERKEMAEVPTSINAVLVARLDRLAVQVKTVVQTAAVLGQEFEVRILSQMLKDDEDLPAKVQQAEAEVIWLALSEIRYIFKHALLRDAAYDMQLRARLRGLHALAGEAIERVYADELSVHYGDLAYHCGKAGDAEREQHYSRLAGEQAAAQFANAEAVRYFSRALDLTPETDYAERYALLRAREKVYDLQGKREAQVQDLTAMKEMADALDDDRKRAEAALRRGDYAEAVGDYQAAVAADQDALSLARAGQSVNLEAESYLQWGRALWLRGEYDAARGQLGRALALAQPAQLRRVEVNSLRNLGIVCWYLGDHAGARDYYEQSLHICREINNRQGESSALNNLGIVALDWGDYAEARAYYEQALNLCREIGDRENESNVLNNLGGVTLQQGEYAEARAYYEQALRLYREIDAPLGESAVLEGLGLLFHHLGDDETACKYSAQSLRIAQAVGSRHMQGFALTYLGRALRGLGRLDEAADAYRQAVALRRELGENNLAMESLAGLARVVLAQGDKAQSLAHTEEILAYLEGNTLDGTDEPFWVYLTCYRVLYANGDPRAQSILNTAHTLLQERAAKIGDEEMRRSFLENVAAHREIVRIFAEGVEQ